MEENNNSLSAEQSAKTIDNELAQFSAASPPLEDCKIGSDSAEILKQELYLGDLLSQILNRELLVVANSKPSFFETERNWLYLLDGSKFEIAVDIAGMYSTASDLSYFMVLADISATIADRFDEHELTIIRSFSETSPLFERSFVVFDKENSYKPLGEVCLAAPFLEQLIADYDSSDEAATVLEPQCNLELLVCCGALEKDPLVSDLSSKPRGKTVWDISQLTFFLKDRSNTGSIRAEPLSSGLLSTGSFFLPCGLNVRGNLLELTLKDKGMDKKQEDFPCTLSLGEIGLAVDDLLNLRPGSKITVQRPAGPLQGALQIGSAKWAAVSVNLEQDKLLLTVERLAALEDIKE